ncbi:unnamed protein product [Haemonchus placei]|uniref:Activin_recp domain-containing protein n=1 Tax=Haemonchus placei TaxID=6290 RepID=A0A0N4W7Q6_HAEPC|nr:unnamed protein product [Haemonchus placei]
MRHTSVSATRSVILLQLLLPSIFTIRCHFYHEIWQDGRKLEIVPDICFSNKYCISVTYRDPNPVKKNGYSVGCDHVDCAGSDNPNSKSWYSTSDGTKCRKHRDFGRHGEVCCCKTDLCNSSPDFVVRPLLGLLIVLVLSFL